MENDLRPTERRRSYAEEKVEKLPRLFNGLQSVTITFDLEAGHNLVEIVAAGTHKSVFVARQQGEDMYACVDQCMHKMEQQLRRHKDRVRDRQGPSHEETMVPGTPAGQ